MRLPAPARSARRAGALAAAALLATVVAGCGSENDDDVTASDPAASSSSSPATDAPTSDTPSSDAATEGGDSSTDGAGDLPAWAPKIITDDAGDVTGLDFSDVPEPDGKLHVAEVTTGDGDPVEAGQTITADYFGQLADQDQPFDESYSSQPFSAPIGVGSLIQGWDQGLVGVPVGSRVVMEIPSDLGYGDAGTGPIPGGATLYFVIDIIDATS